MPPNLLDSTKDNLNRGCQVTVRNYKDLLVWQKAIELVTVVYAATKDFPSEEMYGLKSQLRRAAVSVPSNIAEGQGRASTGEFRQFLGNAKGSLLEVETQLIIAQHLGIMRSETAAPLMKTLAEVLRMLNGLVAALPHSSRRATS